MKPRSQFSALLRAFTRRFVEHELLASRGDVTEAAANVVAILAAFGMGISYLLIQKHLFRLRVSRAQLYLEAWTDEQFLISIAIAVAGLFVIVCWDTLFPDLTDWTGSSRACPGRKASTSISRSRPGLLRA